MALQNRTSNATRLAVEGTLLEIVTTLISGPAQACAHHRPTEIV
jgi:hypothetical protein